MRNTVYCMPVYNEEEMIESVVRGWYSMLWNYTTTGKKNYQKIDGLDSCQM